MTSSVLSEQTDTETLVYSPLQPLLLRSSPLPQQTSPFFSPSSRLCPLSFFLRDKESGSPGGQDSSWPRASAAVWPASFIMDQWLEPLFCQQLQMCDCYCNHMRERCVEITVHLSLKYRITAVILQAVLAYQFKWFYQVCLIFYYSVTLTYCLLGCLCIYSILQSSVVLLWPITTQRFQQWFIVSCTSYQSDGVYCIFSSSVETVLG